MAPGTRYAGKVVVVTGGGRGIGAGVVRAFVESGAQVVICDKDESGGRALEHELPGAVFVLCDVTREDDLRNLILETIRRFGRLDCVVNNAGHHPPPQWPEETSAQGFRQLLELNLLGMYTLTKDFGYAHSCAWCDFQATKLRTRVSHVGSSALPSMPPAGSLKLCVKAFRKSPGKEGDLCVEP